MPQPNPTNLQRPVSRLQVKGFKSIRDMDLELKPLNVLIGANGAGKSNLISVFELLNQLVRSNLQLHVSRCGGANSLLHFGRKSTDQIVITASFGRNDYGCSLVPTDDDNLVFADEWCAYQGEGYSRPYHVPLGAGQRETRLHDEARRYPGRVATYVVAAMQSWRVYHFHDTSTSAKVKTTGNINDNATLRDDAANLAAYLYLLQSHHASIYDGIVAAIRMVAPFFDDFTLSPDRRDPDKIRLEWRERGSDDYFNAHALSDGTLRFMCLATLLQMPDPPATILIDEPELGLHPYAISVLAALLRSASQRTQVIVSTQSVTLVNQFAPEEVIVVDREEGSSVFRRLETNQLGSWLDEYTLGDLWEKNLLGGRPR